MSAWLGPALRVHGQVAAGLVAVACVTALRPPDPPTQAAVLLAGVVLVGMPHGAFDHLVARHVLRSRLGRLWWVPFLVGYLGLAGLVWLGWLLAPAITLGLFLALSMLHFGLGEAEGGPAGTLAVLAKGGLPILLPVALHPVAVAAVFGPLAGVDPGAMAAVLAETRWLLPPWLAVLLPWALRATRRDLAETAVLCLAFIVLPPLLAFALYFCLCHSIRHLLRLGAMLAPDDGSKACRQVLCVVAPAALLCIAGGSLLATRGVDEAMAPLFRTLAALTLPHMAVTLWLERQA